MNPHLPAMLVFNQGMAFELRTKYIRRPKYHVVFRLVKWETAGLNHVFPWCHDIFFSGDSHHQQTTNQQQAYGVKPQPSMGINVNSTNQSAETDFILWIIEEIHEIREFSQPKLESGPQSIGNITHELLSVDPMGLSQRKNSGNPL